MATQSICAQAQAFVAAGIPQAQVLEPDSLDYNAREDSYWSNGSKLKPACIVQPKTTDQVATVVKALVAGKHEFAVRGGGHMMWPGSNNIKGGVTVDMGLMAHTKFHADSERVDIGPGGRWRDVYEELVKYDRVVAGGREGGVGVGGLLIGGGYNYFAGLKGWSCDNVVEYEVVLANGSVVKASSEEHSDLFRALKGGGNNFGIVANYKMPAIPCNKIWGGLHFFPKSGIPQAIEALLTFTDNYHNDPGSNLVCIFTYLPDFKDVVVMAAFVNVEGVERPATYDKWFAIEPTLMSTLKTTTLAQFCAETVIPTQYYDVWFTASFKNDRRIITKCAELHDSLVAELKEFIPDGDFITQCLYQPLPTLFAEHSVAAGGNVMGVERHASNGVLFLATAMVRTPEQEAFVRPRVQAWVNDAKDFAASIEGGNLEWTYLNYADGSQNVLASYGKENVRKMRDAAAKYDPEGVFQDLCSGGFKLKNVGALD